MIYVLNLNPALDYHVSTQDFEFGKTNRSTNESIKIGGKGTNVAIILNNLKIESTLLGFVGGFTGRYISESLEQYPLITNKMITTDVNSRINLKIHGKEETEINSSGSKIKEVYIDELEMQLDALQATDLVIISGKLPEGFEASWYYTIADRLSAREIPFVLDIAIPILKDLCKFKPLLIKPNQDELGIIFDTQIKDVEDCDAYARKLVNMGAQNCLISRGASGSKLYNEQQTFVSPALRERVINTVGAGDSMVAGFIAAYVKQQNLETCYRYACASACASIFHNELADSKRVELYLQAIEIKEQ